ncbi:MAG: hypothetical protein K6F68_01370 [Clostridiales bacterium]|nr:hypothetical protein [Clostridiales bacterium]
MKKSLKLSAVLRGVLYLAIFALLFTAVNLLFTPSHAGVSEFGQVGAFYKEPRNTIDVIGLGSCNLYTSLSPVVMYEKTGITSYNICCADQEFSTSYYYLKDALKTQSPKVVVVEALFFLAENTKKREPYNRLALDYMPLSLNKLELMSELSVRESEWMKQYDPTTPDIPLTFAGYLFPILRFHARNDFNSEDLASPFALSQYSYLKGGTPWYNYTRNDGNFYDQVYNGNTLNEMTLKYIPMIKELCDSNGIEMIVVKSPNYLRWGRDDSYTKPVRDYCEELGIRFMDFQLPEYNNFDIWDYSDHTGRLNVYGMRKFSETLGSYLTENLGLKPTALSDKDRAAWDKCIDFYYKRAQEKGCDCYQGHIARVSSLDGALQVRWNVCDECESFSVYRREGQDGSYVLLTDSASGETYEDTGVVSGRGYTYYVVPNSGSLAGTKSPEVYAEYLDMPDNFTVRNVNGQILLSWDAVDDAERYVLQRRSGKSFAFEDLAVVTGTSFTDDSAVEGRVYYYRLLAESDDGKDSYQSMSEIVYELPRSTPEITEVAFEGGEAVISWQPLNNLSEIAVLRRGPGEEGFTCIAVIGGDETSFRDGNVLSGAEYYYVIAALDSYINFNITSEYSNTVSIRAAE